MNSYSGTAIHDRAVKFLEAETRRRLRTITDSIAADDPAREDSLACLAVYERRAGRAIDAMKEYFNAFLDRLSIHTYGCLGRGFAKDNFAADSEAWFRHFLGQVDQHGVYRRDLWLDTWPAYPDADRCPAVHIRLPGQETAQHVIIAQQRERIDQLRRERDAFDLDRRVLQRRLAELEAAEQLRTTPDSEWDRIIETFRDDIAGAANSLQRMQQYNRELIERRRQTLDPNDPGAVFELEMDLQDLDTKAKDYVRTYFDKRRKGDGR